MDNDKFGYEEMKKTLDSNMEDRQEEIDEAYNNWAYNNMRAEAKQQKMDSLDSLRSKYDQAETHRQKPISVASILDSTKDRATRERQEKENERLDREREEIENQIMNRNIKAYEEIKAEYGIVKKQPTRTSAKEVAPDRLEMVKKVAKYLATAIVAGAIILGAHEIFKHPEPFVPEQTPQSIELEEEINEADSFDEVIEAINENKKQNIESGIKVHPEHVIDDYSSSQGKRR